MTGSRITKAISIIASLLFLFGVMPVGALDGASGYPMVGGHRNWMTATPEQKADRLSQALSLNNDQKAKVLSIYQDEGQQMSALGSNTDMSSQDKRSKMQEIHENTVTQIRALLNPDQAQKYDEIQQKINRHRRVKDNDTASPQS